MRPVFIIFAPTNRFLYAIIGFRPVDRPARGGFLLHPVFGRFRAISRAFAARVVQFIVRAVKVS